MQYSALSSACAEEREQIIFRRAYDPARYAMGGITYFDDMSVETAKKLLALGYIDPDDAQNSAPSAQEMIDFCDDGTEKWYLHGYVVSPTRADCRVTFEGVGSHEDLSAEECLDFWRTFRFADEITCEAGEQAYCWFD